MCSNVYIIIPADVHAPDQIYQKVITVPAVPEVLIQANSTHTFIACT